MKNDHHLVLGASGAQGSAIAKALLTQGEKVRGIVSTRESQVSEGIEKFVADLADPHALQRAFQGITHVSVTIPLVYDHAKVALYIKNIADAALSANIRKLVLNSNIRIPEKLTGFSAFDTRLYVEQFLRNTKIPMISLEPAVYLENLLTPTVINTLKNNNELYYPLPAAMPISWTSHHDLGNAVCAAHKIAQVPEQAIPIGNPSLSGQSLANILGETLNKKIIYCPLDPEKFEYNLANFIGLDAAAGAAGVYHWAFSNRNSNLLSDKGRKINKDLDIHATSPSDWAKVFLIPLMEQSYKNITAID